MNLQAYATHRKELGLRGQSHVAVLNAINDGRLTPPAVQKHGRRWAINPELADQQWAGATDFTERGAMGGSPPAGAPQPVVVPVEPELKGIPKLAASKAVKAAFDAKLSQLSYQHLSGEYVPVKEVKKEAFSVAKTVREALINIPDRVANLLAAETDATAIHMTLTEEITQALQGLANA